MVADSTPVVPFRMPAVFIGHGSPMNTLETNRYTTAWPELGAKLAPLRDRGVLIVASGNIVHNLGRIDWNRADTGFDWTERFNESVRSVMTTSPGRVLATIDHPDFAAAVPTPDHFIPLL